MTTVISAYHHNGLLISVTIPLVFFILSIALLWVKPRMQLAWQIAHTLWMTSGLMLVLIMTLTAVTGNSTTALETHQTVTGLTHSQVSNTYPPDWHDPIGNILMTMPLATALALTWTKSRTVLAISILSTSIEITQYFYGHGRTAQISDVILNTIGGVCGVGLAALGAGIANRLNRTEPKQRLTAS